VGGAGDPPQSSSTAGVSASEHDKAFVYDGCVGRAARLEKKDLTRNFINNNYLVLF
jgi:hypothetical protein